MCLLSSKNFEDTVELSVRTAHLTLRERGQKVQESFSIAVSLGKFAIIFNFSLVILCGIHLIFESVLKPTEKDNFFLFVLIFHVFKCLALSNNFTYELDINNSNKKIFKTL